MGRVVFGERMRVGQDQWVPGLGYIYRNGFNFLPSIVRLEELLSGTLKAGRKGLTLFLTGKGKFWAGHALHA